VESVMREINFSDIALGISEIEEVGPGGSFIDSLHTAEHFRKELWFPKLLNRQYFQAWLDDGALDTAACCRKYKEAVIQKHQPEPIPHDLDCAIQKIVQAAQREGKQ